MELIVVIGVIIYCSVKSTPGICYTRVEGLLGSRVSEPRQEAVPQRPVAPQPKPVPTQQRPTVGSPFEQEMGTVLDPNAFRELERSR